MALETPSTAAVFRPLRVLISDGEDPVEAFDIPWPVYLRLKAHCDISRERAGDVITDAIDLHVDELDGAATFDAVEWVKP